MLAMKSIYEIKQFIKIHGRTTENRNPLTLFWTASGLECNISGSELWIEVEVTYDTFEPWMSITVNDVAVSRVMLQKGRYWICLFRGMNPDTYKNVRIFKDLQAMSDDQNCFLHIWNMKFDGQFGPLPERALKIEFIGDSITSGEGAIGAKKEEDWIPMFFSSLNSYTYFVSKKLCADYRIVSQSGWGVYTSWDGNPTKAIPLYYDEICGLIPGEKNRSIGGTRQNDFMSWQPDFVCINLGTNDDSAFHQETFVDENTGKNYKQRVLEDGTYHPEDIEKVKNAIKSFLYDVRKNNLNANIIWLYGMLGLPMEKTILQAIETYKKDNLDEKVYYLRLEETTDQNKGARNHPGIDNHKLAADKIVQFINEKFERK